MFDGILNWGMHQSTRDCCWNLFGGIKWRQDDRMDGWVVVLLEIVSQNSPNQKTSSKTAGSVWLHLVGRSIFLFFARHEGRLWQGECRSFWSPAKQVHILMLQLKRFCGIIGYSSGPVPSHLYENNNSIWSKIHRTEKIHLWERPPGCTDRLAYSLKGMSATYIQLFCMYPWPFLAAVEVEVDGLAVSNEHTVTWWKDAIRWSLGWKNISGRSWDKCFRTWCTPGKPQLFSAEALRHQWSSDQHTVVVGDFDQHHLGF